MTDTVKFGIRELCRETALGYQFWSLFSFLAPMIWFYPLNAMEVSGYEVFLLGLLSPVVLGWGRLRRLVQTRTGHGLVRLLVLASLGSFQAPDTLTRLGTLALGNLFLMISLTASLWSSHHQRALAVWGLILGLFACLASRIWYTTFLPTWNDVTSNNVVIGVVAVAVIDKIMAGDDRPPSPTAEKDDEPKERESPAHATPWFRVGLGFGGLLFLTHWLFGEVSVITRWGVQPYPDTGLLPYPWGFLVMYAMAVGVVFSSYVHLYNRLAWCVIALLAFLSLYHLSSVYSFCGGLVLAVFTMSLWPTMLDKLTACPPGRAMGTAVLTWMVQILYEIWTVAYNFVPGGVYTREHTGHLIVLIMVTITLGYTAGKPTQHSFRAGYSKPSIKLIGLLLLVGAGGFMARSSKQSWSHPPKLHPKADFSAGVWAFHFGYDNQGWPSMERASDFIRESGVDVVGLLETDASRPYLGNHDLVTWLSERLGMYGDFGPSTRDHTWGVALLSKYPIVASSHHLLPSPHGELAPAIMATINMTGNLVDVLVTHMGNEWDALDRELQAKALAELLSNTNNPVVFLGYVTSKPGTKNYNYLKKEGRVKDIDDTDKKRFCEYIFYRDLIRLGYARVSHGGLSDTELQMARFRIPEDPQTYTDHNTIIKDHKKIDESSRFNPLFGSYKNGHNWAPFHRFHMSTPKYFVL